MSIAIPLLQFYSEKNKIVEHDIEHHKHSIERLEAVRKSITEIANSTTTQAVNVDEINPSTV